MVNAPKVSVGLAVYNGSEYLEEALTSILAQTFADFELIICDNASTDSTEQICRSYAKSDRRIRYFRNDRNIGGANNENLTFRKARGTYFRWAAHDDVLEPTLLQRCVERLDADPGAVLCHSNVTFINEDGERIGSSSRRRTVRSACALFKELTDFGHDCEETYGLMRSEALARTGLQRNYTDSDRTLLAHMALLGNFAHVDEFLFRKRLHPGQSVQQFPDWRTRMVWFGSEYSGKKTYPFLKQFLHYLEIILGTPLSIRTRLCCLAFMPIWLSRYRRWRGLAKDVGVGLIEVTRIGAIMFRIRGKTKHETCDSMVSRVQFEKTSSGSTPQRTSE